MTLAPSDVATAERGALVAIGGRVRRSGEGTFEVFDAFAAVVFEARGAELEDGDLAVIAGRVAASNKLDGASVERRIRAPLGATSTDGSRRAEVERFVERGVGKMLAARAAAIRAVRASFEAMAFVEVETPTMAPCPGLDVHLDAFVVAGARPERFLVTSPEYQMKRLLVGGVPRCFQIGKSFRRAEVGRHHNPEFTMVEWYRAFASLDRVIDDTEQLIVSVAGAVGVAGAPLTKLDLRRPFERMSIAEAFERHASVGEAAMLAMADGDPETFFRTLVDRVEPALASARGPIVVHRYPASMASLARLCPDDERYAERFELYAAGVELCNGFGELTDPAEQRSRFVRDQAERKARGLPVYPIDERFIAALEEGMPPSAGNALGLDRLVMLALGAPSIGDVMAFPDEVL